MKELFSKYRSRLAKESLIKACLAGASLGLAVLFALSGVFYFVSPEIAWLPGAVWWVPVAGFVLVSAIASLLFYNFKYKLSTQTVARRLDELGLDERIITMTEHENDTSYIAQRQREDAMKALNSVKADMLSLRVPAKLIVCAALAVVIGGGAYTMNVLADTGVVAGGGSALEGMLGGAGANGEYEYEITYDIEGDGEIGGEIFQIVKHGDDAETVYAEASDGWVFSHWALPEDLETPIEDGGTDPERTEMAVEEHIYLIAVFVELGENDPDGDPDPNGDPIADPSAPPTNSQPQQGQPNEQPSGMGGGQDDPNNQIIDGETYYGDEQDAAQENASQQMSQNGNVDDATKGTVSDYFNGIQEGGVGNQDP